MKQESSKFDYLEQLIQEQIHSVKSMGPLAFDVMHMVPPAPAEIPVENLIDKILSFQRLVVIPKATLNLREKPFIGENVLRVVSPGEYLLVLEPEAERKLGMQDQWLHVSDSNGLQGYLMSQFVEKSDSYQNAEQSVDEVMGILSQFQRMEIINLYETKMGLSVGLTSKGKNISDRLSGG